MAIGDEPKEKNLRWNPKALGLSTSSELQETGLSTIIYPSGSGSARLSPPLRTMGVASHE